MLFNTALILSASLAMSQAVVISEGTPDGVYGHTINEDGSANNTRIQGLAELPDSYKLSGSSAKFRRTPLPAARSGCTNNILNPQDLAIAQYNLENYCKDSSNVPSKDHITAVSKGSVAYVCNYGGKNTCNAGEAQASFASLGGDCGNPSAPRGGWYVNIPRNFGITTHVV